MKCKFCHNEVAKLVDTHVIPRSFFKLTRGTGKHSVLMGVDEKKLEKKYKQAGVSDQTILCEACESLFGPYDKHGIEAVVDLIKSKQLYRDDFGNPCAYLAKKANYDLFKLFILSVLGRASVSSIEFYASIELGSAHEDRIKQMLVSKNSGADDDYSFVCIHQTGHQYPSTLLPSFQQRIEGVNFTGSICPRA